MAEITLGTINNTLTQVESNTETTSRGIGSFIDYLKGFDFADRMRSAPQYAAGLSTSPITSTGKFLYGF